MCGITGAYLREGGMISNNEYENFNNSLAHRGPDASKICKVGNTWLGHNRLSIIDVSELAHQPLKVEKSGSYFYIIFNGEIYNYIELKKTLERRGHKFRTNSDTEVALRCYIEWGEGCQEMFNGMWSMAIYNPFNSELFISRDRFGVKPLYLFFQGDDSIFFASEVKSFGHLPTRLRLNCDDSTLSFLAKRPNNDPILNGPICSLPAGHSLTIYKNLKTKLKQWWKISNYLVDLSSVSDDELTENFSSLFFSALKLRTRSDAKICSALSGGLDSSSVVSALASAKTDWSKADFQTFIFEYKNSNQSESKFAVDVCNKYDTPYLISDLNPDSSKLTKEMIIDCIYASEQLGSLQIGPYLLYKHMNNEGYKVSIDGHGADEILGGYPQFRISSLIDAYYEGGVKSFEEIAKSWRDDDGNYPGDYEQDLLNISRLVRQNKSSFLGTAFRKYRQQETQSRTLPWILNTYDKLPMRHNIEVRSPFLDWRLIVFSLSLPNRSLLRNGFTKYILRKALKSFLPRSVLQRRSKFGFLPNKNFIMRIPEVHTLIRDTISSSEYLNSSFFDGHHCRIEINRSLDLSDINSLYKLWPTVQMTLFKNKWGKA